MALDPDKLDWLRRNSRIRLDREGRWWFDGKPVENPRVQVLFHKGVVIDAETRRAQLHVGGQWCFIETVEDTAFFVDRVREENAVLCIRLLDGSTEPLNLQSVKGTGPSDLYCNTHAGHRARFLRDALSQLAPWLVESNGQLGLMVSDRFYTIDLDVGE